MNSKQFVSSSASYLWDRCTEFKEKLWKGNTSMFFRLWLIRWPLWVIMSIPRFVSYYTYPAFEKYALTKFLKRKHSVKGLIIAYLIIFFLLFVVQAVFAYFNDQLFIDQSDSTKNFFEDWVDILNYTLVCEAYIILGGTFLMNMYKLEGRLINTEILTENIDNNKRRTNISSIVSIVLIVMISILIVLGYKDEILKSDSIYWFMESSGDEVSYGYAGYYYLVMSVLLMMIVLWVAFAHFGLFKVSTKISQRLKRDLTSGEYSFWKDENSVKNKLAPFSWLIVNSKAFVLVIAINLMLWKFNEPNRDLMYNLSVLVVAIFGIWVFSLPRYYIQYYYFKIRKKLNFEEYKDLRIPWVLGVSSVIDIVLISIN